MTGILENLQILIVEDTLTQAMMIQHVLEKLGAKTKVAKSGDKALKELAETDNLPGLILCDVNMPGMSGFELCTAIKADERLASITFVLLSTLVESSDLLNVIECGADDFIYKNFEGEYFKERLQCILENKIADELGPSIAPKISIGREKHTVQIQGQRLANLLVSSFEAAIFHNRNAKG
ncbi:MAG TPA: response regulator [Drouetiella sp.]